MDRASSVAGQLTPLGAVAGVYTAYIWKNVTFTFWFGAATLESCATMEEGCRKCAAEHPERLSSINVMIPGGRNMPDAAARAEIVRIVREYGNSTAALAVLIPGSGFWASALRSVTVALSMVRPQGMPMQIFGDTAQLSDWLAPIHSERTGVPLTAAELLSVIQELERALAVTVAAA